jgi:hypothetical protein
MRVIRINTTAYSDRDFYLLTTLSDEQISKCLDNIISDERNGVGLEYDNDDLFEVLKNEHPNEKIEMWNGIETLEL